MLLRIITTRNAKEERDIPVDVFRMSKAQQEHWMRKHGIACVFAPVQERAPA